MAKHGEGFNDVVDAFRWRDPPDINECGVWSLRRNWEIETLYAGRDHDYFASEAKPY